MPPSAKTTAVAIAEFVKSVQIQSASPTQPIELPEYYDLLHMNMHDNFPTSGVLGTGQNGTPSYYYLNEPSKIELKIMARKTPFGYRLTHLLGKDVFNNNFFFRFPLNNFKKIETDRINSEIESELLKINFYQESRLWYSYNKEQGRAGLWVARTGDGVQPLDKRSLSDPLYEMFNTKADTSKDVIRVQAIDYNDYEVEHMGAFGETEQFIINFWGKMNSKRSFMVHPSRIVEMKTDKIDLDAYKGQSSLKACFAQLQILNQIYWDIDDALYRWGHGWPWFKFKGLRGQADWQKAINAVGNPHAKSFFISGPELEDIKMMGVQQSQMNISEIFDMMIDSICVSNGIPRVIMLGDQVGVTKAGEVFERQYFQTLSKEHRAIDPFIREFLSICPQIQRIFKKYKIETFVIDWGISQALSENEKALLDMQLYSNANAAAMYVPWASVLQMMHHPTWTEIAEKDPKARERINYIYGQEPEVLDLTCPRAGELRQIFLQGVLTSPEERAAQEAASNQQMLGENKNPTNYARSQGAAMPTNAAGGGGMSGATEARRRELKSIRAEDQASDTVRLLREELGRARATIDMQAQTIEDLAKESLGVIEKLRSYKEMGDKQMSWNNLAEAANVNRSSLQRTVDALKLIADKKEEEKDA